ncbi:MAG: DnaJ domain-containing protein [Pseudanabaenaceae cyanobacterium bins.68]|nr:DnaJ domain-containing protein [Pseudanabaenaceae cyanobacterium bins.68]
MAANLASTFRITKGIGQFHSSDHFAALGLPVTATSQQIRQRYLTIVRRLHPDIYGLSPEDKEIACQYLAKLVSPAYNTLINERERVEYSALIRLIAKRLVKQQKAIEPSAAIAHKLLVAPQVYAYEKAVETLASQQYACVQQSMQLTAQLSELNLVYLVKTEGYSLPSPTPPITSSTAPPSAAPIFVLSQVQPLIQAQQWSEALKELRQLLTQEPQNPEIHALLGLVYLNQKLDGMAKVSFTQALKYDPHNQIALQNLAQISSKGANPKTIKDNDKKSGFFGWLGGS